jgi:type II secretory pathway component GspD/PulD (secretin)
VFRLGFIDADFQLDAYLQILEQEGVLDIGASPSIVTRNGVPAVIESIEEIPYLTPATITLGGTVQFNIANKSVGIKLNVVPFLVGADTIHLTITAEVSRLSREIVVGVDASNNPISVPGTSKRTATTSVLVKNGNRVVIGGLKLKEQRRNQARIPFLGQLPIIGWLFSNDSTEEIVTDVYFVIEPKVKPVPTIEKIGDIFDPFEKQ